MRYSIMFVGIMFKPITPEGHGCALLGASLVPAEPEVVVAQVGLARADERLLHALERVRVDILHIGRLGRLAADVVFGSSLYG
jgi:hypothetical protein